jgi:hypothetical protein
MVIERYRLFAKLATCPLPSGSGDERRTIEMPDVACFGARTGAVE